MLICSRQKYKLAVALDEHSQQGLVTESPGRKQMWQLKTDQNGVGVWLGSRSRYMYCILLYSMYNVYSAVVVAFATYKSRFIGLQMQRQQETANTGA